MARAGEYDTRIELLEPKYAGDKREQTVTYESRIRCWAKVESLVVRDQPGFRQPGMKATARLTIRQSRDLVARLKDDWRLKYRGCQYAIESIDHLPDRVDTVVTAYRKEN